MGEFAEQMRTNAKAKVNRKRMSHEPIKKEIYEKPGKKMAQNPFQPKSEPSTLPAKSKGGMDFKKSAIQRRIAKMGNKKNEEVKKVGGK